MAQPDAPYIDGPIAGQSLTFELGNRPWQNPPQFNTVEETLEYYIPRFLDSDISEQLMDVIEMGIPLTTIANAMQTGGVMQGYHTLDVADIEYRVGTEDDRLKKSNFNDSTIALAKKRLKEKMSEKEKVEDNIKKDVVEETEEPQGLMARRS
jgi:hypothetical protein